MSGKAFKDTQPISLDELSYVWIDLFTCLTNSGLKNITPIGSTWKKEVMGDIDLAAEGDEADVIAKLQRELGEQNVKHLGGRLFSIKYPVTYVEHHVQVDVIIGDVKYLKWSRFGPSTMKNHAYFSPVKGVIRNLFLNTILRESTTILKGHERTRYVLDYDVGMNFVEQTILGAKENVLKNWKTTFSQFVTNDPDDITKRIFGKGVASDTLTFEDCLSLAKKSDKVDMVRLKKVFIQELEDIVTTRPTMLGESLINTISYVKDG